MTQALLAIVVVSITAALGCANERVYMDPQQNLGGRSVPTSIQDARLQGDFGPRVGFDGDASDVDAVTDPDLRTSRVIVTRDEAERGTAMVIIATSGITLDQLRPGAYEFANDLNSMETAAVAMSVCSGDAPDSIDYDSPADRVTLTVTQTQTGRAFDFHTETVSLDDGEVQSSATAFVLGDAEETPENGG